MSDNPEQVDSESSDQSEYLEFRTPTQQRVPDEENVDQYSWDHHREQLSFESSPEEAVAPFHFDNTAGPLAVWPPRHLSSETDFNFLEAEDIPNPRENLETLEEVLDEIFEEETVIEVDPEEMPPKTKPTVEELFAKFKGSLRTWNTTVSRLRDKGANLKASTIEDMRNRRIDLEEKADEIYASCDEGSEILTELDGYIAQIGDDIDDLYDKEAQVNEDHQDAAANPDDNTEKVIKKLASVFDYNNSVIDELINKVKVVVQTDPVPNLKTVESVKKLENEARDKSKSTEDTYLKILAEISCFESQTKKDENIKQYEQVLKQITLKGEVVSSEVQVYVNKLPKYENPAGSKSIPLERLPLPKFGGKKMEYNRFKLDFATHVKYETEEERLLALKERCLTKPADKDRVANQNSIADCWAVLDAEYGDTETTVCDVFKQWKNLKTPTTDRQLIDFVDKVENGVACLKSLQATKELTASAVVNLEELLNEEMQKEVSRLIVTKNADVTRMDVVMKYLRDHKSAAQLRCSNYSNKNSKTGKKDESSTSSSNTSFRGRGQVKQRGRGRGGNNQKSDNAEDRPARGRGRGRGGRGRGGRGKRGASVDKCLLCEEQHSLSRCPKWQDEETDKRYLLGFAYSLMPFCTWCLNQGHTVFKCYSEEDYGCPCGSNYNMYICCATPDCVSRKNWSETSSGNNVTAANDVSANAVVVNGTVMGEAILPIQMIDVDQANKPLRAMFDNCSQNTFISNATAEYLNLNGPNISFVLICTNGSKTKMKSKLFKVTLIDVNGDHHQIEAIGIQELSSKYAGFQVTGIKKVLANDPSCKMLTDQKLNRSSGVVDLLIGSDVASIHPEKIAQIGELTIMKSKFGSGFTVMGHNAKYVKYTDKYKGSKVNFVAVEQMKFEDEVFCNVVGTKDVQFLEAIATESLGVNVAAKCKSCKVKSENCKECKMIFKSTSYLEHLQDKQIEDSIEKIKDAPGYIASYPYNNEINLLLPNEEICIKRAENIETTMKKRPADMKQLNAVIHEGFTKGTFKWLSDDEIKNWDGLVHYVPMNVVYKESESTPCRCIFDSGQPDFNGRSLNSCMGKGKNPINNFGTVILNFRAAEKVASGDIKKMFNQIAVRDQDMHLRRFYMRPDGFGGTQPWRVAVPTCVNFGETAAPSVATKVKNRTAEDNKEISETVAKMIVNNCIMDDINVDCKYEEDINENIKKAEQILANGKFSFKKWIKSGDKAEKNFDNDESVTKSLGISWKTEADLLVYRIKLNFSKKKRNRYSDPDTTLMTLDDDFPLDMNKRIALKLNHSLFDPANLVQPWLLKLRLSFRDILFYERENNYSDWDRALPQHFRDQWLQLTRELFQLESLEFPRSVVPRGYDSSIKPILVLFSDGSDLGQCAVAYLVWTMQNGSHHVSLVTSRTKIASMTKISTPRSELAASQLQSRLGTWLIEEMNIEVGEVLHLVDASIVLGMIRNVSLKFDTYTAPRVTEIQTSTNIEEWFWVDTKENPSDVGTRGKCTVEDLGPGKMWREGPGWLKQPRDTWPLRSDFKKHQVPGLKKEFEILPTVSNLTQLVSVHNEVFSEPDPINEIQVFNSNVAVDDQSIDVTKLIPSENYRSWQKLLLVSAFTIKAIYKFRKLSPPSLAELMKIARNQWLQFMMQETRKMLKTVKLSGFLIHEVDGILYATTRTPQVNNNPDGLIILSPSHPITKKILFDFHCINHAGVQNCVARSRIFYWIPQASKIVKGIKDNCFKCRIKDAEAMKQLMSPMPSYRLKPSPIWHFSMLDLFGPIEIKDFVNQRTSRKTWGVIITCLTSRACWVYLAESYSTDHLLSVLKKHESRNGSPCQYFADLGRQIVGADRVLSEAIHNIDTNKIETFAAKRNVKFTFGVPYFPEGQGAVERLIAEVKKSLKVIVKHNSLSFGEMDSLLAEASSMVNSRPLQPHPTAGEDGFLCPNDVLLGRSDRDPPDVVVADMSLTKRAVYKQKIMSEYWEKWSTSYYQSLMKYSKWKYKSRNAEPGDVVMILDKEHSKGKFALGVVDSVKIDEDNIVRKVVVKYKLRQTANRNSNIFKYAERNVRGLALLISVQERAETENFDFDKLRFRSTNPNDIPKEEEIFDDDSTIEDKKELEKDKVEVKEVAQGKDEIDSRKTLPPTSSGRKRFLPKKFY